MSVEVETAPVMMQDFHKSKKDKKDKSSKKHDKKRKREDAAGTPSKKPRSESKDNDAVETSPAAKRKSTRSDSQTPFFVQTSSIYVPLAPISQSRPLEGICVEHLSPLLLTYHPPFHGVVLAYSNVRLSESPYTLPKSGDASETTDPPARKVVLARAVDEYAATFVWVTADFLVLNPGRGTWIEGYVNLQSEGHLSLVCWNLFNASISRRRLPRDWKWVGAGEKKKGNQVAGGQEDSAHETSLEDAEGYWEDGEGNKVDGLVRFKVLDVESSPSSDRDRGFLSIEGSMLDGENEEERTVRRSGARQSRNGFEGNSATRMSGALSSGQTGATDVMEVDTSL